MKGIIIPFILCIVLCLNTRCKQCNSTDPSPFVLYLDVQAPQKIDTVMGLTATGNLIPCFYRKVESSVDLFLDPSKNQCSFIVVSSNPARQDTINYTYLPRVRFEDVKCGFEGIFDNIKATSPSIPDSAFLSPFHLELP